MFRLKFETIVDLVHILLIILMVFAAVPQLQQVGISIRDFYVAEKRDYAMKTCTSDVDLVPSKVSVIRSSVALHTPMIASVQRSGKYSSATKYSFRRGSR